MGKHCLVIKGRIVSFNEYINAERHNRYEAARIKKDETERVAWEAKAQKLPVFTRKVNINYHIFVDNDRQDEDSHFYGIKIANDGLVMAGVIRSDSRKWLHIVNVIFHDKGKECKLVLDIDDSVLA